MAIRLCPECGHEVSTRAETCPGCGLRFRLSAAEAAEKAFYDDVNAERRALRHAEALSGAWGCAKTGCGCLVLLVVGYFLFVLFLTVYQATRRRAAEPVPATAPDPGPPQAPTFAPAPPEFPDRPGPVGEPDATPKAVADPSVEDARDLATRREIFAAFRSAVRAAEAETEAKFPKSKEPFDDPEGAFLFRSRRKAFLELRSRAARREVLTRFKIDGAQLDTIDEEGRREKWPVK